MKSTGAIAIAGSSTTSAPSSSSSVRSSLACSRARVTTIVRPKSGRCSNQEKSRAATSPTTIADGASTPTVAIVASVARVVRCSGRVPQRTAATGVSGARPPRDERVGDVGDAAGTHEDHERAAGAGERVPVGVDRSLRRILVTGDDRDARRDASVCHGNPGVRGRGDRAGDAGHDLERQSGVDARFGFFTAAPEHERVPALEPHDGQARRDLARRGAR